VIDVAMTSVIEAFQDYQVIGGYTGSPGNQYWSGYIDEFRITRNHARYTELAAPLGPFPLEGCANSFGIVTSVDVSGGTTGLITTGGPVTTSGTITIGGTLNIASGGTGQTTASGALNALLPAQAGLPGYVLTTDGTTASWQAGGGGAAVTQIIAGTNVSITPSGGTGAVTINSSAGLGPGTYGSINVPNNGLATVTHGLGRIPLIMLWVAEGDWPSINTPSLVGVTTTTFKIAASGSGGIVYYQYW
jgi:hypothetical protein